MAATLKILSRKRYTIEEVCGKLATNGKIVVLEISGDADNHDNNNISFFIVKPKDIKGLIKFIKLEYGHLIINADDMNIYFEKKYKKFIENNILFSRMGHYDYSQLKIYGLTENQFNMIVNPENFTEFKKSGEAEILNC
ncbi:putative ORFan [Tupanvirus deep ocean]|uniref:ORFan n=2 Tax=Tupanvirus TaxID=2094720 RepID=A0AC62AA32_9VIRU|nr:putative ORFan [Tupanvirus deep ocean]QKU34625.1 putative ORFan [Tupanvirus deep ocean]